MTPEDRARLLIDQQLDHSEHALWCISHHVSLGGGEMESDVDDGRGDNTLPSVPRTEGRPSDAASPPQEPETPTYPKQSIWAKAKETLSEVSAQATSVGGALASKSVAVGSPVAAKAAEIGKQTYSVAGDATRTAVQAGKHAYTGSKLESALQYIDGELDQRGAKQAIKSTTGAVVDKLDQVTGKRLLELLEEKLRIQDAYNDILATRLAEALERIAKLEARIGDDEDGH